ncbi:MAG: ATP-binding protein [Pseudomonadota bacterium]|nr:ATP-binding protein [Pseudomonadota bacterium]MDP1903877.1 ATP-binding protein [Pseudomonadota bacterium]MDP2353625.1 ATP-binding protein [Pseudomonadota bacterium]
MFPVSWQVLLAYALCSLVLDAASNPQTVLPLALVPWTPPIGLALAFLLLHGSRYAPWLIAVTFLLGLPVHGQPGDWLAALWAATLLMLGLLGISTWLIRGLKIDSGLSSQRDLSWFVVAAVVGAMLDSGVHVFARSPEAAPDVWAWGADLVNYWVGALIRLLVIAPLVLVHARHDWAAWRSWRPSREMILQAITIAVALAVIFGLKFTDEFKFFYLLFLPLIWVAMRHGIQGATAALAYIHIGLNAILEWRGLHVVAVVEFQMLMLGLTITGLFLGLTVSARRAAEEKLHQREAELNQAMRLAAAGEMTQAIAHELNQPLSALANYARASRAMLDAPEQHGTLLAETLGKIDREATRAGQVVHRLREFFRGGGLRLETLSAAELIEEGLAPARRRAERAGIAVSVDLHGDLPLFLADRVQMGTVLHNLLVNAIEAIESDDPKTRAIAITVRQLDAGRLRFCVRDSGRGVVPEMRGRLFESFATSKPEGMGLGLTISRTLVEAHGGELLLDNLRPTRFCFTLPIQP